jgi:hypothetical protein
VPDETRERLAAGQTALIDALAGYAVPPPGFDVSRVELAGQTLLSKRAKSIAKLWPNLAIALEADFSSLFNEFALHHPVDPNGPASEAFAFARWLDARRSLPPSASAEFVEAQLRRGPPIALRMRRSDGGFIVGVRLPLLGSRVLTFFHG